MTDARLRGEWLNTMRFDALSDTAWRVFTSGLMWSAENGTNGLVPNRYLRMLHPNGEQPEAFREIAAAALGVQEATGFVFLDWDGALGQSTALQVETYKENGRNRARKYRERQRVALAKSAQLVVFEAKGTPAPVPRDVTRDVRPYVGKGKGKGAVVQEVSGNETQLVNPQTGEVTSPTLTWDTAIPGEPVKALDKPVKKSSFPKCRLCGQQATHLDSAGLCRKVTPDHMHARAAA